MMRTSTYFINAIYKMLNLKKIWSMFSAYIVCHGQHLDKFNKALPISYIVVYDLGKIINNNTIFYRNKNKTYVGCSEK